MYRLLETIKVLDKKLLNIEYHNARVNNSRQKLFGIDAPIDLSEGIIFPNALSDNIFFKCRVIYSDKILSVDFLPYEKRLPAALTIVNDDTISYEHKFEDRSAIQKHLCKVVTGEILIVKNGLITDTSYSNVVFSDGEKYFTPASPLLYGTKRAKLLKEKIIFEDEIRQGDIKRFKWIYLVNAMIDLNETDRISVDKIICANERIS